jgi:hypothetical protein
MSRHRIIPALLALALAVPACGDDDTTADGGPDGTDTVVPPDGADGDADADGDGEVTPGSCEFGTPPAATPVTEGAPATFETVAGAAMNTMELDTLSPVPPAALGALRAGPCGVVGLAYRRTVGSDTELAYVELDDGSTRAPGAPATVAAGEPGLGLTLFYEDDCSPVILQVDGAEWLEHTTDGTVWTAGDTGLDLAALTGASWLQQPAAVVGRDARWHLFAQAGAGASARLVHGARAATSGSGWSWEALPMPEATEVDAYAVDSGGGIHVLYRNQVFPCDPSCDVNLYHGRLPVGGTWSRETAQAGIWGPPLDEFVDESSLAIDEAGRPVFAGHFVRRVETGSLQSAELRAWVGGGDGFCGEPAVLANDGYAGEDGTRFTGAEPFVVQDGAGRTFVLFLDQSVWHDGSGYANEIRGQLRLAVRSAGGWSTTRLVDQPGRTESPNPLVGYGQAQLALSPDGTRFVAVAVERTWETDSIYNTSEVPLTLRAQAVYGTLAP